MGKRQQRQRREAMIRALQAAAGTDRDLTEHMVDKQIAPQQKAAELRAEGHEVDLVLVNTDVHSEGHLVRCVGCDRVARLPFAPPAGKVVLCPTCQRGER